MCSKKKRKSNVPGLALPRKLAKQKSTLALVELGNGLVGIAKRDRVTQSEAKNLDTLIWTQNRRVTGTRAFPTKMPRQACRQVSSYLPKTAGPAGIITHLKFVRVTSNFVHLLPPPRTQKRWRLASRKICLPHSRTDNMHCFVSTLRCMAFWNFFLLLFFRALLFIIFIYSHVMSEACVL